MITLHLNLDTNQPVQFSSLEAMKKTIIANPFKFDGLALFQDLADEDCLVNLVYVNLGDGRTFWEVEEFPKFESSSYTIQEAVDEFAKCLSELGVY